jgi:hypothetical protein
VTRQAPGPGRGCGRRGRDSQPSPRLAESARGRVYGRPRGAGTRQAPQSPGGLTGHGHGRGDSLLEAAWLRQFIYVYSFMRIRHLGFFLIDLFSDY